MPLKNLYPPHFVFTGHIFLILKVLTSCKLLRVANTSLLSVTARSAY